LGYVYQGVVFDLPYKRKEIDGLKRFIAENIKGILAVKREIKMRLYYSLF